VWTDLKKKKIKKLKKKKKKVFHASFRIVNPNPSTLLVETIMGLDFGSYAGPKWAYFWTYFIPF
jgi:hypothetical protein